MGSPQNVTDDQYKQLEAADSLKETEGAIDYKVTNGKLTLKLSLEGQAVTLYSITWK